MKKIFCKKCGQRIISKILPIEPIKIESNPDFYSLFDLEEKKVRQYRIEKLTLVSNDSFDEDTGEQLFKRVMECKNKCCKYVSDLGTKKQILKRRILKRSFTLSSLSNL